MRAGLASKQHKILIHFGLLTSFRIRRIKCDGSRPSCRKCFETGRICDGFPSDQCALRPVGNKDKEELRSFVYFSEKTSLELSGHYDEVSWRVSTYRIMLMISAVLLATSSLSNQLWLSSPPSSRCRHRRATRITQANRTGMRVNPFDYH